MEDRPREIEVGEMSHTEKLFSWIKKICSKKKKVKYSYFMRAVLSHAMNQAKVELLTKQRLRRNRWIKLRRNLLKDIHYGSCSKFNIEEERKRALNVPDNKKMKAMWWDKDIKEDISNLNNFLLLCSSRR